MTPAATNSRGRLTRRAFAAGLLLLLLAALAATLPLAGCGGSADPFTGLYWEPSTGRRIEIGQKDGGYWLYYGAGKQPYPAKRDGDELTIAEPMGGQTTLRPGTAEGTLEMTTAGKTTVLKPLPQHQ